MGVPKFYRWISERYPCLSEVIKEYQMPEFDNLYFDMNGIIHVCSHPNDDDPHFRISEEKIFADIFHYIEVLFRIIKPQKVFFMAVDGVAPRAKMNQQRGRRFRSAREAKQLEEEAIRKGETLPKDDRFDSNCITPGTEFMVRLQEQLKFFVKSKISTDKMWQGIRIFLSGHETPGEGEHKIMDFIRYEKSSPNYDPNTKHCLYGLDADLIMLGLCSHEPHFSLLREEVRFGGKKSQKRVSTVEQTTFHLLHLTLMREYLEHEFESLKGNLSFEFNIENIIDDWVLMGFLVGNDFIPHLPNLHIAHDALPTLYKAYKDALPTLDGYLNEGGTLNLQRFEIFMKRLAQVDYDKFEENYADLKWLEGKSSEKKTKNSEINGNHVPGNNLFDCLANLGSDMDSMTLHESSSEENLIDLSNEVKHAVTLSSDSESLNDDEVFELEFQTMKRDYYMNKLQLEFVTPGILDDQAFGYVRAIQWNLHYYYNGVSSWSWFYPHHYAPYISDIKNFSDKKLEYDYSSPFLPYQQLLAVLPSLSKKLLPQAYQNLMCSQDSPLIEFYPTDFKTDLNGKTQDWEAVVLIPFLDEKKLIEAMKIYEPNLTKSERERNRHGPCLLYTFSQEHSGSLKSILPSYLPDIPFNHAVLTEIDKEKYRMKPSEIKKGLCDSIQLDVYFPGFPTLKHIPHTGALKKAGVTVFQMQSRKDNMILKVSYEENRKPIDVARELLGNTVYVSWPHIIEAKVTAISTPTTKFSLHNDNSLENDDVEINNFDEMGKKLIKNQRQAINNKHMNRLGIDLGEPNLVVHAQPMTGRKYMFTSNGRVTFEKQFSSVPQVYPIQTLIKDIAVHNSSLKPYVSVDDMFPEKTTVFMLGHPNYGCQGEIINIDRTSKCKIRVKIFIPSEPDLDQVFRQQKRLADRYLPGYIVAQKLGISSHFVSRVTGTMLIIPTLRQHHVDGNSGNRINIGLNLKFNKRNEEVPGYTKKTEGAWLYSYRAIEVIGDYLRKFPDLWDKVFDNVGSDIFHIEDIFPDDNGREKLQEVQDFLKNLSCANIDRQACGSEVLDAGIIKAIEEAVDKVNNKSQKLKCANVLVRPKHLHKPSYKSAIIPPDEAADFQLFDRVVNIREGHSVPLGLRGTVIGIHRGETRQDYIYDVIFDSKFMGGISIQCSPLRGYKMPETALINLSYGARKNSANNSTLEQESVGNNHRNSSPVNNHKKPKTYAQVSSEINKKSDYSSLKSDKYVRINHSPTSPFQPQSNAKFITPRVSLSSTAAKTSSQSVTSSSNDEKSPVKSPSKHSIKQQYFQSGNTGEFLNIWESLKQNKSLQKSKETVKQDKLKGEISLEHAAKSLPKVEKFSHKSLDKKEKNEREKPGRLTENDNTVKQQEEIVNLSNVKSNQDDLKSYNEEGSAALKELLHISDTSNDCNEEPKTPITVEQLFKGAAAVPVTKTNTEQSSHQTSSSSTKGAVVELLTFLQSKYAGMPVYRHADIGKMVTAEVTLPNGSKFFSGPFDTNQKASESAAAQALASLMRSDASNSFKHGQTSAIPYSTYSGAPLRTMMPQYRPQNQLPHNPQMFRPPNLTNYRHQQALPHRFPPPHHIDNYNFQFNQRLIQPQMPPILPCSNLPKSNFHHKVNPYQYPNWSLGNDIMKSEFNALKQPRFPPPVENYIVANQNRATQSSDNLQSHTNPSVLSPHSNPFIPLQVTKQQTPRKKTVSESQEDAEVNKNDNIKSPEQQSSEPVDNTEELSGKESVKPKSNSAHRAPRSRLACNFSNP